jgi:hypothetical protein
LVQDDLTIAVVAVLNIKGSLHHEIHRRLRSRRSWHLGRGMSGDPRMFSQGETKQRAIENMKDAIKQCLEVRIERGMPLAIEPEPIEVTE